MDNPLARQPDHVALDKLRFATQSRVGAYVRQSARIQTVEDIITRQLIVTLEADVLAEKLAPETVQATRTEPKTWVDYLKRDVWYTDLTHDRIMRWIARRWPIRYRQLTVQMELERHHTYPEANIIPPLGNPVIFERWQEPRWQIEKE